MLPEKKGEDQQPGGETLSLSRRGMWLKKGTSPLLEGRKNTQNYERERHFHRSRTVREGTALI